MKGLRKRGLSVIMTLCLLLTMVPSGAAVDENGEDSEVELFSTSVVIHAQTIGSAGDGRHTLATELRSNSNSADDIVIDSIPEAGEVLSRVLLNNGDLTEGTDYTHDTANQTITLQWSAVEEKAVEGENTLTLEYSSNDELGSPVIRSETHTFDYTVSNTVAEGYCGAVGNEQNVRWLLEDDGVLTISGTGEMANYGEDEEPWSQYQSSITRVIVNSGVTNIGANAFCGLDALEDVDLPENISIIGTSAFINCISLPEISIPNSVTTIGEYAFSGCSVLSSVEIPANVSCVGEYAFRNCTALGSVTIQGRLEVIERGMFEGCTSLPEIEIPDGVTVIGNEAFSQCTSLARVTIPSEVTQIGESAFAGCPDGADVWYGGSETQWEAVSIGTNNEYFQNATIHYSTYNSPPGVFMFDGNGGTGSMETVTVAANSDGTATYVLPSNGFTPPAGMVFRAWSVNGEEHRPGDSVTISPDAVGDDVQMPVTTITALWEEELSNIVAQGTCGEPGNEQNVRWTLTSDGTLTISGAGNMADFDYNISTGVVYSPWYAYRSSIIRSVVEAGVTNVGSNAFRDHTRLTNVYLSESVAVIGEGALYDCSSLTDITVADSNINYASDDGVLFDKRMSLLILYPAEKPDASYIIPDSVTRISESAFYGNSHLSSISIPDSVTDIGQYAFYGCSTLNDVTIPNGVNAVSDYTFYGCANLTDISIPDGVTSIGSYAFYGCSRLTNASLPESITSIEEYAFYGCSRLENMIVPDNVTSIGMSAFGGCSALSSVTIPNGVTNIASGTFANCTDLNWIAVRNGVTAIRGRAFYGCSNLTDVYYSGSETQWQEIELVETGNDPLLNATIHYNSDGPESYDDPYGILSAIPDMDTFADQIWHLAGPLPEFLSLSIDETTLTQGTDYTAESGSTKLNIPASTFERFGEGSHTIAAQFENQVGENHVTSQVYTVFPANGIQLDLSDFDGDGSTGYVYIPFPGRVRTNPAVTDDWVEYEIDGEVPSGLTFNDGRFLGIPSSGEEKTFRVRARLSRNGETRSDWTDWGEVTIRIIEDASSGELQMESDPGYELRQGIPDIIEGQVAESYEFYSEGPFEEFKALYLDGRLLTRDVDYTVRSGSTLDTVRQHVITPLSVGDHVITDLFEHTTESGEKEIKRTTDTFTIRKPSTGGGGGGGSSRSSGYGITVSSATNGRLSVNRSTAARGSTVTITATPNSGYRVGSVTVRDSAGNNVQVSGSGSTYSFTMPARRVTVSASFTSATYSVSIASAQNGTISASRSSVASGNTVTITARPDKGYLVESVMYNGTQATRSSENVYTFTMPAGNVTVRAVFKAETLAQFTDISGPDWFFYDAKWAYSYKSGLIRGVTEQYWEPQSLISSVTSVVTLERLDDVDLTPYYTNEDDGLDNSTWYVAAARWAKVNGILLDDRPFGERDPLTRGEYAVMLRNFLRYRQIDTTPTETAAFSDAWRMTPDELEAFQFLNEVGVFLGDSGGAMLPQNQVKRSHLAALLHRLSDYIIQVESEMWEADDSRNP